MKIPSPFSYPHAIQMLYDLLFFCGTLKKIFLVDIGNQTMFFIVHTIGVNGDQNKTFLTSFYVPQKKVIPVCE